MELLFGLIFTACGFGFIPVAIWAFVLRKRWQKTQRSLSEVEQELTNVRTDSLAEQERRVVDVAGFARVRERL